MIRLKNILKRLFKIIRDPAMLFLPGNLAFFLVLSIFPILTLVGVIASIFSISINFSLISNLLPHDVMEILLPYTQGRGFDSNVGIFMILGFILASNGADALVIASNTLYGIPNSNYLKRRIKDLFLIFFIILLVIFLFAFLGFGNQILNFVMGYIENENVKSLIYKIFYVLKYPFAIFVVYFNIKIIYTIAPDSKIYSKTTTKGALFTTFAWTLATIIFSYYISHFSNYSIFYGGLSNIIVLILWIYILAYILVIGIAINGGQYVVNQPVNTEIE
ncbi:MAG: YihY/virulence factor BrkB family protein [Bacilli bacterium]|nr:YihY/virulence factor BrkB family protein [Bacilli bacterium]